MGNFFLAARWIGEALQRYRERPPSATIKGKPIVYSEQEYTAALLHIYVSPGKNLSKIADLAQITVEQLSTRRSQIDFMTLIDYLKTRFTAWYREILVIEDFFPAQYGDICREFLLLDGMVQTQIRVPLWTQLRQLGLSLGNKIETGLPIDPYQIGVFKRLLSFFAFIEMLRPNASQRKMQESLMPIAKSLFKKEWETFERQAKEMHLGENVTNQLTQDLRKRIGT